MLVRVHDALFGYGGRAVVSAADLALRASRCLGIFGPNGAGKTTLVRGVTGLLPPLAGRVVHTPPRSAPLRFAYMPQHGAPEPHWPMTALDAAAMTTSARRPFGWLGAAAATVRASMRALGVDDLADRPFARLSGGQQQRILLAGAMASEPDVLVLDEPTDGLDVHSRDTLLDLLRDLAARGLCTAIISHDVEDLLSLCDEIAWVHPADEPGQPSRVETLPPADFARRVTQRRTTRGAV